MSKRDRADWTPPPGSAKIWGDSMAAVLEDYKAFATRWRATPPTVRKEYITGWGRTRESRAQGFFESAWYAGDFNPDFSWGVRYTVRLRHAPRSNALTDEVLQQRDPYIVLRNEGEFLLVRRIDDDVEGYIKSSNSKKYSTDLPPTLADTTAVTWEGGESFSIRGLTTFDIPGSLLELLLLRVHLIDQKDSWTYHQAFIRDIFKEGRMVNYGAKSGKEILNESCACPFHPITDHILRLINYPLPQEPEPWRKVSIVYNRYRPGQGCMAHKNWAGTTKHCYLHFSEGLASCRFSFYTKDNERTQSRRVKNQIFVLGPAVDRKLLHGVADIRGGVHYSLAIRTIADDWEDWRDFKQAGGQVPDRIKLKLGVGIGYGDQKEDDGSESASDDDMKIVTTEMNRIQGSIARDLDACKPDDPK